MSYAQNWPEEAGRAVESAADVPGQPSPELARRVAVCYLNGHDTDALSVPGAAFKLLSLDRERGYVVALGKLDPCAHYPSHHHFGGEDLYMLTGDLKIGDQVLHAGDYHHAAAETTHPINSSADGCTLLIVLSTETLLAQLTAK